MDENGRKIISRGWPRRGARDVEGFADCVLGITGSENGAAAHGREATRRIADIDRERHAVLLPALAADQDLSRPPVEVLEPDRDHLLSSKAKPGHQQKHRVVATADPIVAVDRVDQPPDLVGVQVACLGTGTSLCNTRNAKCQVVLAPAGREQEAEDAAQTRCLVVETGPARCRLRGRSWLFAGSDRGGRRAAAMYTPIGTAKLNDVVRWRRQRLRTPRRRAAACCSLQPSCASSAWTRPSSLRSRSRMTR